MKKTPYALDSYIIRSSKNPKKFRVIYGKKDMAFMKTEATYQNKYKKDKINRANGNKDGKRYYIAWSSGKKSNYFFSLNQAKYIALKNSKNKNYYLGNPTIFEETKDGNDWIITYEQELLHYE